LIAARIPDIEWDAPQPVRPPDAGVTDNGVLATIEVTRTELPQR